MTKKFLMGCLVLLLCSQLAGIPPHRCSPDEKDQSTLPLLTNDTTRFRDHGVASPYANSRGMIAAVDGNGNNVLLIWLFDHRGSYGMLWIDVNSGHTRQFDMPFPIGGDAVYTSILSSKGKIYTLYNSHFAEFDPEAGAFTFYGGTTPRMAMSMTEDDEGRIWAVTYPNSGLVRFDPDSGELEDFGSLHAENWAQYPRYIAVDDQGWVYFAIGNTNRQIIAFHPETKERIQVLADADRGKGMAYVYRNKNGKVYGRSSEQAGGDWLELYGGQINTLGTDHTPDPARIITGRQTLQHLEFPDGQKVEKVDLIHRRYVVRNTDGSRRTLDFDYETEGAWLMNVITAPDRKHIVGAGSFPFRLFRYNPAADSWERTRAHGQFNAMASNDQYVFFGSYPGGILLNWDFNPIGSGDMEKRDAVPRILEKCGPVIYRPHRVLPLPDNRTVIMGGTPDYGYTGGGLLLYDLSTGKSKLLTDTSIIPDQSTKSLTPLTRGTILGGTTTTPGTGGERKADQAFLYEMDPKTSQVTWKAPSLPGVQDYSDLMTRSDGKVYGIADYGTFFVFDPETRKIVHSRDFREELGRTIGSQSPQIFVRGHDEIYVLLAKGICRVNPETYHLDLVAEAPHPITSGGTWLDGRIYYISGSHLCSFRITGEVAGLKSTTIPTK